MHATDKNGPRTMQAPTQKLYSVKQSQSGAALIVGLVLMMVLTVLAVSTMRTATLELAMSGNAQFREKARQLAEAGIADAIGQINDDVYEPVASPVNQGNWTVGIVNGELEPGSGDAYRVDIRYLNTGAPPPGFSADIQANYFEIQSTGSTMARNAQSVVVQGFWTEAR
jgi:hypothetical protein